MTLPPGRSATPAAFSAFLRNAGLRENDYINNRSQVAVRTQIVEAVSDGYKAPGKPGFPGWIRRPSTLIIRR